MRSHTDPVAQPLWPILVKIVTGLFNIAEPTTQMLLNLSGIDFE